MKYLLALLVVLPVIAFFYWRPIGPPTKFEDTANYLQRRYPTWGAKADADTRALFFCELNLESHVELHAPNERPTNALHVQEIQLSANAVEEVAKQTGVTPPTHFLACLMPGAGDHTQSVALAQLFFNKNSRHWLAHHRRQEFKNFPMLIGRYADWLRKHKLDREDFCLDNGDVMAVYGVRDTNDIDILHDGHRRTIKAQGPELFADHNKVVATIKGFPWKSEEVVNNPALHLYYYGYKIASFEVMRKMKELRRRDKDLVDLVEMAAMERNEPYVSVEESIPQFDATADHLERRYPGWGAELAGRKRNGLLTNTDHDVLALTYCLERSDCRLVVQEEAPQQALYSKRVRLTAQGQQALPGWAPEQTVWLIEGQTDDSRAETVRLAPIVLNDNSLHFVNNRRSEKLERFSQRFADLKAWVAAAHVPADLLCIESGAVLAAYGLRDSDDIDLLHLTHQVLLDPRVPRGCESHNADAIKRGGFTPEEIVTNPALHFTYDGIKFAALSVVRSAKERRGGEKDTKDLALIDQVNCAN